MKRAIKNACMVIPAAVVTAFLGTFSAQAAVAVSEEPAVVKAVPPTYPRSAERREIEGMVQVSINVNADGSVGGVTVVQADPAGIFDMAAISAVERWQFESGKPAQGVLKTIRFKIGE